MSIFWFLWGIATGYYLDSLRWRRTGRKNLSKMWQKRFWWNKDASKIPDLFIGLVGVIDFVGAAYMSTWGLLFDTSDAVSHLIGAGIYFAVVYGLIENPERQERLRDWTMNRLWPWLRTSPQSVWQRLGGWWKTLRGRRAVERERSGRDTQASFNALADRLLQEIDDLALLGPLKARVRTVVELELPRLLERRRLLLEEIPRVEALLSEVKGTENEKTKEAERTREILQRMGGELQKVETTLGDLRRSLHFVPAVVSETKLGLLTADSTSKKAIEDLNRVVEAIHESVEVEMLPALPDGANAPPEESTEATPPPGARAKTRTS